MVGHETLDLVAKVRILPWQPQWCRGENPSPGAKQKMTIAGHFLYSVFYKLEQSI